jgi:hypothetical protein
MRTLIRGIQPTLPRGSLVLRPAAWSGKRHPAARATAGQGMGERPAGGKGRPSGTRGGGDDRGGDESAAAGRVLQPHGGRAGGGAAGTCRCSGGCCLHGHGVDGEDPEVETRRPTVRRANRPGAEGVHEHIKYGTSQGDAAHGGERDPDGSSSERRRR